MRKTTLQKLLRRKRRIVRRLRDRDWQPRATPMFSASKMHYEVADRVHGLGGGGIGVMSSLAWTLKA